MKGVKAGKKRIGMNVQFRGAPPLGVELVYDKQVYRLVRYEDHHLHWASACRVCHAPFEAETGFKINWFTRTCPDHRARSYAQRVTASIDVQVSDFVPFAASHDISEGE